MLLSQDVFLFLHDLMRLLHQIESICFFLLIGFIVAFLFLFNQENLYMIHHDLDLFYDIYKIQWINIIKSKIIALHWCFQVIFMSTKEWFKKFFNNFICLIINHDFLVITFSMHHMIFIIIFKGNKTNCSIICFLFQFFQSKKISYIFN